MKNRPKIYISILQIRECLGQLAVSTEDETQWKYLNYQVLLCIRNSELKVTQCWILTWLWKLICCTCHQLISRCIIRKFDIANLIYSEGKKKHSACLKMIKRTPLLSNSEMIPISWLAFDKLQIEFYKNKINFFRFDCSSWTLLTCSWTRRARTIWQSCRTRFPSLPKPSTTTTAAWRPNVESWSRKWKKYLVTQWKVTLSKL